MNDDGIDGQRLLKLGNGLVEFSVLAKLLATMDDHRASLEADVFKRRTIAEVLRLQVVGLLKEIVSGFILLPGFSVLTLCV